MNEDYNDFKKWNLLSEPKIAKFLCRIKAEYMISEFTLDYLAKISDLIKQEYNIPEFKTNDLLDKDIKEEFTKKYIENKIDKKIVEWVNISIHDMNVVIEKINIDNLDQLDILVDVIEQFDKKIQDIKNINEPLFKKLLIDFLDKIVNLKFIKNSVELNILNIKKR